MMTAQLIENKRQQKTSVGAVMTVTAAHWVLKDGEVFQVAVAFAHREDKSLKWVTVGLRCVACGVLGAYADWKIDYEPTAHLYAAV